MTTERNIRKWEGTKVQTSELLRRGQEGTARSTSRRRQVVRSGWSTFASAPGLDEFEAGAERTPRRASITPPRRSEKPGGASILVPEGEWSVEQQLREERDRRL